jgi:hypothetical protein
MAWGISSKRNCAAQSISAVSIETLGRFMRSHLL